MKSSAPGLPGIRPGALRRRTVDLSQGSLVRERFLELGEHRLSTFEPAVEGVHAAAWAETNRERIAGALREHGGVLFRGFGIADLERFQAFMDASNAAGLLEYRYRSTPRSQVSGRIYTSTEYPANQTIPQHNEMSYTHRWPLKIWFCSVEVAAEGGETPLCDSRRVYARLDPALRDRLAARRVMYVRNYGEGMDLTWQNVFQTEDRAEAEAFCRQAGIDFAWKDGDRLRTRQVCQAVAEHPQTGETVWFNQAHLFHVSALRPEVRSSLEAAFAPDDLPRNACYGDGAPFEDEVLAAIRAAYEAETFAFPWQQGDVLMLDNMLMAHGRRPFRGARKVLVGMAEEVGLEAA